LAAIFGGDTAEVQNQAGPGWGHGFSSIGGRGALFGSSVWVGQAVFGWSFSTDLASADRDALIDVSSTLIGLCW
jgi:hypothetical protein